MIRHWLLIGLLPIGGLAAAVPASGLAQEPDKTPANPENIDAALKLTQAAAAEYEFRVGKDEKPLQLQREPVLRWSNPDRGEVHGNIFLWTRGGRPLMVGSLFKWFTPWTHMTHEFQLLAEGPVAAKFHGQPVWETEEPGLKFMALPDAPAPAAGDARRFLQMKQLAKEFSADKQEKEDTAPSPLRLLPQPVYRYAAPKEGVLAGGMFALVHGTDPEIWLLLEARGKGAAAARWEYAAARMNSVTMNLQHNGKKVQTFEWLLAKHVNAHTRSYTKFMFEAVPNFLKDAPAKSKSTGGAP